MFDIERGENARWIRARAEECRTVAMSTTEPELRQSYTQLAECYEAMASECEASSSPDLPSQDVAWLRRTPFVRSSIPSALT
jgi:hypothetical protein